MNYKEHLGDQLPSKAREADHGHENASRQPDHSYDFGRVFTRTGMCG